MVRRLVMSASCRTAGAGRHLRCNAGSRRGGRPAIVLGGILDDVGDLFDWGGHVRRRVHVVVRGRVQGVGFRYWVADAADAVGVAGWVRNTPGGDVEAEVEGDPEAVDRVLAVLREGPPAAVVTGVHTQDVPVRDDAGFRVTY
jgi:acylphosphatase